MGPVSGGDVKREVARMASNRQYGRNGLVRIQHFLRWGGQESSFLAPNFGRIQQLILSSFIDFSLQCRRQTATSLIAKWRRGTRVWLITRRSMDRNHPSLTVGRETLSACSNFLIIPFHFGRVAGSKPAGATNVFMAP